MVEKINYNIKENSSLEKWFESVKEELSDIKKQLAEANRKIDFILKFNLQDKDFLKFAEKEKIEAITSFSDMVSDKVGIALETKNELKILNSEYDEENKIA